MVSHFLKTTRAIIFSLSPRLQNSDTIRVSSSVTHTAIILAGIDLELPNRGAVNGQGRKDPQGVRQGPSPPAASNQGPLWEPGRDKRYEANEETGSEMM